MAEGPGVEFTVDVSFEEELLQTLLQDLTEDQIEDALEVLLNIAPGLVRYELICYLKRIGHFIKTGTPYPHFH